MGAKPCKIEFRDVRLAYDDVVVLKHVSFCVAAGELKIVIGRSGAGKSTLLRLALGLIKPDDGEILIDGINITKLEEEDLNPIRRRMGIVFQGAALFSSLTIYENVAFRPREMGWSEQKIDREVRRVLEFVGMLDAADKLPDELSIGMKRRVGIARAIVDRPDIILFDEPTAGLDPPTARSMCELVVRLRDIEGITSMFVTHKLDDVRFLSSMYVEATPSVETRIVSEDGQVCLINTKIIMLNGGEIIFDGTDEQLWASPDPRVRRFILGGDAADQKALNSNGS
ncbi:MAG TPA: ATP-binding cassette domain-containing protein [Blastocatellia bacterium]|nr:ATP-binding cassette domain-containing protein [Blastocatellia bacterium]